MNNKNLKLNTPEISDLISLRKASELSGLSQGHLSLLIRNGVLWGTKLGSRNWFTTEEAVQSYLKSNPKPGPKPFKERLTNI
ncbi:DNA-binding protein [Chloroflexota bacterium]